MTRHRRWILGVLVLAGLALGVMPTSRAEALTPACAALGGVGPATDCVITITGAAATNVTVAGNMTLAPTDRITVKCSPVSCINVGPLVFNVAGNFSMQPGSVIDGTTSGPGSNPGHGADIRVNATGDITLSGGSPGAVVQSNHALTSSCVNISAGVPSRGGNLSFIADSDNNFAGNFDQGGGSLIASISACGGGELIVAGKDINIDGEARTEGFTTIGRGGPITVNAKCNLNVSTTGEIISLGRDPGADLVHLQGGCDVKVLGLVASTGAGHTRPFKNRCDSNNPGAAIRPGKPTNSAACVEIWSGGPLLIDSATANGEVNADVGQTGGPEGKGWIEIFAVKDITIKGNLSGGCTPITYTAGGLGTLPTYTPCFSVHANQGAPGPGGKSQGFGGLIRVTSTTGSVIADNLAIQATDTANGGSGGRPELTIFCTAGAPCGGITIEGDQNVNLAGAKVEAKGAANGHGGQIDVHAFNLAILASASTALNVSGGTPPDGEVNLTACTTIAFGPGVVIPAAASAPPLGSQSPGTGCGTHPVLPAYVDTVIGALPFLGPFPTVSGVPGSTKGCPTQCGSPGECQCVSTFSFDSTTHILTLNGTNLDTVTDVRLSTASCATTTGTAVAPPFASQNDTTITINLTGVVLPTVPGNYHVITESPVNVCCTKDTVLIP